MRIDGEWYECDDEVLRPVVRGEVLNAHDSWEPVLFLVDTGADCTVFSAAILDVLGFEDDTKRQLRKFIHGPYGMVLVTGPTGSGKTTTLYACLAEIQSSEDKIITIEDPVEYQLKGVSQIPVNEKKGLTFARGLRSILRHDPDKIMVGEIRDEETAQIAVQSALTGHLVFTTVHANNVVDVIGRFLNMNVHLYNFVSALNCVLAQRLVRKICTHCKRPATVSDRLLDDSGLDPDRYRDFTFYEGVSKAVNAYWTSAGYLDQSQGFLSEWFVNLASNPGTLAVVDLLNVWWLILVGLGLYQWDVQRRLRVLADSRPD